MVCSHRLVRPACGVGVSRSMAGGCGARRAGLAASGAPRGLRRPDHPTELPGPFAVQRRTSVVGPTSDAQRPGFAAGPRFHARPCARGGGRRAAARSWRALLLRRFFDLRSPRAGVPAGLAGVRAVVRRRWRPAAARVPRLPTVGHPSDIMSSSAWSRRRRRLSMCVYALACTSLCPGVSAVRRPALAAASRA